MLLKLFKLTYRKLTCDVIIELHTLKKGTMTKKITKIGTFILIVSLNIH